MPRNLGQTALPRARRRGDPMRAFDALPPDLRNWLRAASLPWSPRSAERAYRKALERCGDQRLALRELDALQARLIARDAGRVWGAGHPARDA